MSGAISGSLNVAHLKIDVISFAISGETLLIFDPE